AALPGARSLVVGARSYRRAMPSRPVDGRPVARVARYSWRDHYQPLRDALTQIAGRLEADGWRTRVLADENHLVDREAAYRACPPNRAEDRRSPPPPPAADDEAWVPVLDVLAAGDDELLDRFGRWYIPRRQPRYLRRNALVVLGNVGDGRDPEVVAALRRALTDPDPLLRSHAVWAAARLDRRDLLDAVADDVDP